MRRLIMILAVLGVFTMTSTVLAAVVGSYTLTDGGPGLEGPFLMTPHASNSAAASTPFLTFCVERAEYFNWGGTYQFSSNDAENETVATGRVLSGYSAWVYTKFRANQSYFLATQARCDTVQKAIWAGMLGQVGDVSSQSKIGQVVLADWTSYTDAVNGYPYRNLSLLGNYNGSEWGRTPTGNSTTDAANMVAMWTEFETVGQGPLSLSWTNFVTEWVNGNNPQHTAYGYTSTGGTPVVLLYNNGAQDFLTLSTDIGIEDVTPTPEPASLIVWSLLGCLGVGLGWRRSRKAA